MLLFDDSKALEKALGTEAAAILAHVFEKADEKSRQELATKTDLTVGLAATKAELTANLAATKAELTANLAATKAEIIKWVAGMLVAQFAALAALIKFG